MDKKIYAKPQLVSRKVELGVFGQYGRDEGDNGASHHVVPLPIRTLTADDFRME
ncbi:MAG: hypothetical protein GY838_00895 [bacterium]|nr:hypothetical protein [bacterium]